MGRALTQAGALADAEEALRLAALDPRGALRLATRALAQPGHGAEAGSVAERALGIAHRELLDVPSARRHLRRAVRLAERADLPVRAGEARLSLALELLHDGRPRAALRELDAASGLVGDAHAQVHNQLAAVYARLGRYVVARVAATRALAIAERGDDPSLVALVLGNRGIMAAYCGDLAAAEADLRRAVALSRSLGEALGALDGVHNLAWVLSRKGDLPAALELFDEAERGIRELDVPVAPYRLDRAEALLAAGLPSEAGSLADAAAEELRRGGLDVLLPEAQLLAARSWLAAGDPGAAVARARTARRAARRQGRRGWAAAAAAVVAAGTAAGPPSRRSLRSCLEAAESVAGTGWREAALEARLVTGRLAERLGDLAVADASYAAVAEARRRGPARTRLLGWTAQARRSALLGDRRAALRACDAGLRLAHEHAATLGATDMHAAAAGSAADLGRLGVRLARDAGDPDLLLRWSERSRATSLHRPPVRPPADSEQAADLAALRAVVAEVAALHLEGHDDDGRLRARQAALEEAVRRRSRHARGSGSALTAAPAPGELRRLLDGRPAHVLVEDDQRLLALRVGPRTTELRDLGPAATAQLEARHLAFALRRQVLGDDGATQQVAVAASRLAAALGVDDVANDCVVVPTGPLHAVPWSLLPGTSGHAVEVAPSLALWARPPAPSTGRRVAVSGPGLPAAPDEVRAVPEATVLVDATAEEVLAAVDGADLAHLACHAVFRPDNPLFSALLLSDGPLTVYDLQRLDRAPATVLLSACDSGRNAVRAGDELLGLAAALFALGTRHVVASVVPVGDAAAAALMAAWHAAAGTGLGPAAALAVAQRSVAAPHRPTASAFVCLTAGQP